MELQLLPGMFVPLERVNAQEHTQMKGVVGAVGGFLTSPAGRVDPRQVAVEFTQANPQLLSGYEAFTMSKEVQNATRGAMLSPAAMRRSPGGYHVQLQQTYQGIPVYSGRASVHMTYQRRVYFFTNDLSTDSPEIDLGKGPAPGISCQAALESLAAHLPWQERLRSDPRCKCVFLPTGGALRLTWCIDLGLLPEEPILWTRSLTGCGGGDFLTCSTGRSPSMRGHLWATGPGSCPRAGRSCWAKVRCAMLKTPASSCMNWGMPSRRPR